MRHNLHRIVLADTIGVTCQFQSGKEAHDQDLVCRGKAVRFHLSAELFDGLRYVV